MESYHSFEIKRGNWSHRVNTKGELAVEWEQTSQGTVYSFSIAKAQFDDEILRGALARDLEDNVVYEHEFFFRSPLQTKIFVIGDDSISELASESNVDKIDIMYEEVGDGEGIGLNITVTLGYSISVTSKSYAVNWEDQVNEFEIDTLQGKWYFQMLRPNPMSYGDGPDDPVSPFIVLPAFGQQTGYCFTHMQYRPQDLTYDLVGPISEEAYISFFPSAVLGSNVGVDLFVAYDPQDTNKMRPVSIILTN